ncbi:hypothetical protein [Pseudomonas helleri]|uniref:hypothetical protein n=1 Tax=Pseudomonas helleri TaxID=1608996 RepID=UPI00333F7AAF
MTASSQHRHAGQVSGPAHRSNALLRTSGESHTAVESGITLAQQFSECLAYIEKHITLWSEPYANCILFFTVSAHDKEATVFFVRRATLEAAWREGTTRVRQWVWARKLHNVELRVDWPHDVTACNDPSVFNRQMDRRSASAWAIADDDFEYAELIQPIQPFPSRQITFGARMNLHLPLNSSASMPMNLLLRLRGFHMGGDGARTALPRTTIVPTPLHTRPTQVAGTMRTQLLPFSASLQQLTRQQQAAGNWLGMERGDHMGMTYSLLLMQRHLSVDDPAHPTLVKTTERAVKYLAGYIDSLLAYPDCAFIEQALCLLVLTRYITDRSACNDLPRLIIPMEQLAQNLAAVQPDAPASTRLWMTLALNAFAQCQAHVNDETAPAPSEVIAPVTDICSLEWLVETFFESLSSTGNADDNGYSFSGYQDRWQSIAITEYAFQNIAPLISDTQTYRHFECHLEKIINFFNQQIVWPELALFLPPAMREQAAFFHLPPSRGLVTNCRSTAHLLVTAYAICTMVGDANPKNINQ